VYIKQTKPDEFAILDNGNEVKPLVTFINECGIDVAHIIEDDRCVVLIVNRGDGRYHMTYHWFKEAVQALRSYCEDGMWLMDH
jgi:hypothetical protein